MWEPGSPLDVLFCIPLHPSQAPYRLQEPGTKMVVPCPVFSAPGKSHSQGCDVLGAMSCWPLAFFYHAGNVSITLMHLLSAKRSKSSLLRQTCLSPGETSHLVSPSHSSILHVLVNPNKFGYVRLFMGKNKT